MNANLNHDSYVSPWVVVALAALLLVVQTQGCIEVSEFVVPWVLKEVVTQDVHLVLLAVLVASCLHCLLEPGYGGFQNALHPDFRTFPPNPNQKPIFQIDQ